MKEVNLNQLIIPMRNIFQRLRNLVPLLPLSLQMSFEMHIAQLL